MTLRIGLIGCGFIGRFHASNLRHLVKHQAPIAYQAVCDHSLERARAFAQIAGCETVTTDAQALIESDALDALYICTETSGHPQLVEAAALAGKHVFCEKPLAKNYHDALRMLQAVENAGVTHQVGLVLRFSPVYRVLEDLMKDPDLGPMLAVQLRDDQFFPTRGHYASAWRGDVEKAGGGTLIEHSIHDVDLLSRLVGPIERTSCTTRFTSGHKGIEDIAMASLQHAGGVTTHLASVWHGLNDRSSTRRLEIFFERGWFMTEHDYFGSLTMQRDRGEPVVLSPDEVLNRFMALEGLHQGDHDLRSLTALGDRRFCEAARAGSAAMPSFHEAVAAHRVVEACYRSARDAQTVDVNAVD
ncbi:MAG: Gfo/Idh/MocA family oxidoreductase [Gammaproteobacteria bacterium]|nr:Gfo/Idh/MocA family oxidoreductase [Gammaproteobacteria bacterium]